MLDKDTESMSNEALIFEAMELATKPNFVNRLMKLRKEIKKREISKECIRCNKKIDGWDFAIRQGVCSECEDDLIEELKKEGVL
mgnify:CR=1 FL=1